MEDKDWKKFTLKLQQNVSQIQECIFSDSDELKALGLVALLHRDLEQFLKEQWDKPACLFRKSSEVYSS